ncbi:hypothetical protein D9C73_016876 [Collichthys lucidus]|uniref:Uncharacterized protein n=1 Tax=Collichthys lucidus TaxID=240159 RepID=A0A4U5V4J8_COLLU|nr:hypothetical protein D9C73_016876 [Collichthys lucidus]
MPHRELLRAASLHPSASITARASLRTETETQTQTGPRADDGSTYEGFVSRSSCVFSHPALIHKMADIIELGPAYGENRAGPDRTGPGLSASVRRLMSNRGR